MHWDLGRKEFTEPDTPVCDRVSLDYRLVGVRRHSPSWRASKFPRALRWVGALFLMGVGLWMALLLSALVYTHIFTQGARACENWYEGESEWSQLPDTAI